MSFCVSSFISRGSSHPALWNSPIHDQSTSIISAAAFFPAAAIETLLFISSHDVGKVFTVLL